MATRAQTIFKLREKRAVAVSKHRPRRAIDAKLQKKMFRQLKFEIKESRHGNV